MWLGMVSPLPVLRALLVPLPHQPRSPSVHVIRDGKSPTCATSPTGSATTSALPHPLSMWLAICATSLTLLEKFCRILPGLGIRSSVFWANRYFFFSSKKRANERFAQKTSNSLIFLSNLSDSLTITLKKSGNELIARFFKNFLKGKNKMLFKFVWENRSFFVSEEQPERIAHGYSFVMSDLGDSLTAGPLSWAIWANRSHRSLKWAILSKWAKEQWGNEQISWISLYLIMLYVT